MMFAKRNVSNVKKMPSNILTEKSNSKTQLFTGRGWIAEGDAGFWPGSLSGWVIWSPQYLIYKIRLEQIKNSFLRFAARQLGIPMLSREHDYSGIRALLNIQKIKWKFLFAELSFLYNILNNQIEFPQIAAKMNLCDPSKSLRSNILFKINNHRTNHGTNSVFSRIRK